jgi:hypothetical protein
LEMQKDGAELSSPVSDLYLFSIVRVTCLLRLTIRIFRHLYMLV